MSDLSGTLVSMKHTQSWVMLGNRLWRPSKADVDEAQMCAQANLGDPIPRRTAKKFATAIHLIREDAGMQVSAEECLLKVLEVVIASELNSRSPLRGTT
jgi:hypothetical protein